MTNQFVAVADSDVGTCEALGWTTSVRPYLLVEGDDAEAVLDRAMEKAGEQVTVYDIVNRRVVEFVPRDRS